MSSITKHGVVVVLVGVFVMAWRIQTHEDIAVAQTRKPIMMTRIYTGADGQSHAEQVEMKLNGNVSEMMKATGVEFSRRAPGPVSDGHRPHDQERRSRRADCRHDSAGRSVGERRVQVGARASPKINEELQRGAM